MEHSQSQITDHSSEHIQSEVMELCDHPEDDLTAILKAKDQMIKTLQLGNLCFKQKADGLEAKVDELKEGLEIAGNRFGVINQVLAVIPAAVLSGDVLKGVLFVLRCLADEGESEVEHNLAMFQLPDAVNRSTDAED